MKRVLLLWWLLAAVHTLYAQQWTPSDSLRLQQLLEQEGEITIDRSLLAPSGGTPMMGTPQHDGSKPWLDFNVSLPSVSQEESVSKPRLTLRPYNTRVRYDWDPVYQREIAVNKDTWRSDPLSGFTSGLMARVSREPKAVPSGHDLMLLFTRDFWQFRQRRNRTRTLQVLQCYGKGQPD